MEKKRLFVDMDGTLAQFVPVKALEDLYEPGRFFNLPVMEPVCEAVRAVIQKEKDVEVFILSAVLIDSKYALDEKNRWLDTYLPEVDSMHRIFPPCGRNKAEYIPGGVRNTDYLLDDYTQNLIPWLQSGGQGIKLYNGINGTKGNWKGNALTIKRGHEGLFECLQSIFLTKHIIRDPNPNPDIPFDVPGLSPPRKITGREAEESIREKQLFWNAESIRDAVEDRKSYYEEGMDIPSPLDFALVINCIENKNTVWFDVESGVNLNSVVYKREQVLSMIQSGELIPIKSRDWDRLQEHYIHGSHDNALFEHFDKWTKAQQPKVLQQEITPDIDMEMER